MTGLAKVFNNIVLPDAPAYEPGKWVGTHTNCLDYARNDRTEKDKPSVVGDLAGKPYAGTDPDKIIEAAVLDGMELASGPEPKDGFYLVALVVSGDDVHWIRQDNDGHWSHKRGTHYVGRKDLNHVPIKNPRYGCWEPYEFVACFYIPKGGLHAPAPIAAAAPLQKSSPGLAS